MTQPPGPPPQAALMQIVYGPFAARAVAAVAELGIPDLLADGPQTSDAVAAALGLDPGALGRFMRALVMNGIFVAGEDGRFSNGPLGALLRTGVPGSMRDYVLYASSIELVQAWDRVLDVLRTGEPSFEAAQGMPFWDYLGAHPEFGARFDRAMTALGGGAAAALLAATGGELDRFQTIVDAGGGQGHYLGGILAGKPHLRGVLFDLPQVVAGAGAVLDRLGVRDRVEIVAGDVFESVPAGHGLYIMKTVLHDWDDAKAAAILRSCRQAVRPDSELWLIEAVLPDGAEPHPARFPDLHMLVALGGRERAAKEWKALAASAGFALDRTVAMPGPQSVVVLRPA